MWWLCMPIMLLSVFLMKLFCICLYGNIVDDSLLALIVFSLQYILVSHEYWKYKVKYVRWKVTLKVHLGSFWKLLQLGSYFCFSLTLVDKTKLSNSCIYWIFFHQWLAWVLTSTNNTKQTYEKSKNNRALYACNPFFFFFG